MKDSLLKRSWITREDIRIMIYANSSCRLTRLLYYTRLIREKQLCQKMTRLIYRRFTLNVKAMIIIMIEDVSVSKRRMISACSLANMTSSWYNKEFKRCNATTREAWSATNLMKMIHRSFLKILTFMRFFTSKIKNTKVWRTWNEMFRRNVEILMITKF